MRRVGAVVKQIVVLVEFIWSSRFVSLFGAPFA
jgi:hypothetical protein